MISGDGKGKGKGKGKGEHRGHADASQPRLWDEQLEGTKAFIAQVSKILMQDFRESPPWKPSIIVAFCAID